MSTSPSQPYLKRAPRYVLAADDELEMRYSPMSKRGAAAVSRLRDLSTTGLAFTLVGGPAAAIDGEVDEGDMIKIEFTVPGRRQIACFATVVRIEDRQSWSPQAGDTGYTLVAVQYRNLPTLHRRTLELGLKGRVSDEPDFDWNKARRRQLFVLTGLGVAQLLSFWYMVQPPRLWIDALRLLLNLI